MCQHVFEFKNKILNYLKSYEINRNPIMYINKKTSQKNV